MSAATRDASGSRCTSGELLQRARPWLLLLLAVALGPHCWCFKREVLVELDGPIAVKWEFKRRPSGGGRGVGIAETHTLLFTKPQTFSFEVHCNDPEPKLMAAPSTTELSYQCAPGADWKVIYLSPSQPRAFEHCELSLGTRSAPDWDQLLDFQQASPELLGCLNRRKCHLRKALVPLFEEVRARGGDDGLRDLLIGSRAVPFCRLAKPGAPAEQYDLWDQWLAELPPKHREEVVATLRQDLESKDGDPVALERALWTVETVAPPLLVDRARELVSRGNIPPLQHLLARLGRIPHDEAGPLACSVLPADAEQGLRIEESVLHVALAVVASRQAECPSVTAHLVRNREAKYIDCETDAAAHLCTAEELGGEMDEVLRIVATQRGRSPKYKGGTWFRALLAAAYAQGELPESVRAAASSRQELRRQCRAFAAWWKQLQEGIRAEAPQTKTGQAPPAQWAAARRRRAKAYRAEGAKPLQFEDERLRGMEKRMKALFSEVATAEDEVAVALGQDDKSAKLGANKRVLDLTMKLDDIASEQRSLCTGL